MTRSGADDLPVVEAPLGGTKAQALQRAQVGIAGLVLMGLMVGLASLVRDRADEVETNVVPEAAATVEPAADAAQNDPLAEAGVVPDMTAQETPAPQAAPSPGQGQPTTTPAPGSTDAPPAQ